MSNHTEITTNKAIANRYKTLRNMDCADVRTLYSKAVENRPERKNFFCMIWAILREEFGPDALLAFHTACANRDAAAERTRHADATQACETLIRYINDEPNAIGATVAGLREIMAHSIRQYDAAGIVADVVATLSSDAREEKAA